MSVLKQNQNAYDAYNVMDTVIMGNQRLYDIGKEKEALYAKEEMTDEDGMLACQLEEEFAELGGAVAVAPEKLQVHVGEQRGAAVVQAQVGDGNHSLLL